MAIKRVISTEFWTDRKVVDTFSPEDKLFMFYLLTNPHTTQLGIYPFIVKIAAFEIGYSAEAVITLAERFERIHQIVRLSRTTGEIAIKNYLRHSIVKGGTPVRDLLEKEAQRVKDKSLLKYVLDANADNPNQTVREFVLKLQLGTNDYDNDNDNENDDSCPNRGRIVDDSSKLNNVNVFSKKEPKHQHGEYKNVLLTDSELAKLQSEYPDWQERIERLSGYMASKGTTYKNHLATIRNWAKREAEKPPGRPSKEVGAHRYDQRQYTESQLDAGTSDLVAEAKRAREGRK